MSYGVLEQFHLKDTNDLLGYVFDGGIIFRILHSEDNLKIKLRVEEIVFPKKSKLIMPIMEKYKNFEIGKEIEFILGGCNDDLYLTYIGTTESLKNFLKFIKELTCF